MSDFEKYTAFGVKTILGVSFCMSNIDERDEDFIASIGEDMINDLALDKNDDTFEIISAGLTAVFIGAWLRGYSAHIHHMEEAE